MHGSVVVQAECRRAKCIRSIFLLGTRTLLDSLQSGRKGSVRKKSEKKAFSSCHDSVVVKAEYCQSKWWESIHAFNMATFKFFPERQKRVS